MTRSGRVCWSRSPLPSWRLPFFSILHTSRHTLRPHIKDNGSGGGRFDRLLFCCLLALGESTPGSVPSPCFPWATAIGPPEVRRRGVGGRRWGPAGGRRRFVAWGPKGSQATKPTQGRGPRAPAPALCALCAPAAPPGRCGFLPAKRVIHHPFPTSASYKQNEPAAPHERRAGIFRRKTEEVFQLVFPRFFQKRAGSRGRAPGGVRGSAPEKAPEEPARHPSAGRDWARRRRAGKSPWG